MGSAHGSLLSLSQAQGLVVLVLLLSGRLVPCASPWLGPGLLQECRLLHDARSLQDSVGLS